MEAWILHIREDYVSHFGLIDHKDTYSAWSTEKQAYKHASVYLLKISQHFYVEPLGNALALQDAITSLVEADKISKAIALVNRYSEMIKPSHLGETASNKVTIAIIKSKFLGSAFE